MSHVSLEQFIENLFLAYMNCLIPVSCLVEECQKHYSTTEEQILSILKTKKNILKTNEGYILRTLVPPTESLFTSSHLEDEMEEPNEPTIIHDETTSILSKDSKESSPTIHFDSPSSNRTDYFLSPKPVEPQTVYTIKENKNCITSPCQSEHSVYSDTSPWEEEKEESNEKTPSQRLEFLRMSKKNKREYILEKFSLPQKESIQECPDITHVLCLLFENNQNLPFQLCELQFIIYDYYHFGKQRGKEKVYCCLRQRIHQMSQYDKYNARLKCLYKGWKLKKLSKNNYVWQSIPQISGN